jgi:phosphorylated adapter RNA export protein
MRSGRVRERAAVEEQRKRAEIAARQQQRAIRTAVDDVVSYLAESDPHFRVSVERAVVALGIEWVQGLRAEVEAIEDAGGMPVADGSRRRTPGGVFLYLLKQRLTDSGQKELLKQIMAK